jgi:hypothetical protein
MHQTVAGESHAVQVPLDENLLGGIALTRKSVEATSMGERDAIVLCLMHSFNTPRQDLKCRPFDQGIVAVRTSSSGEILDMRASLRKGESLSQKVA